MDLRILAILILTGYIWIGVLVTCFWAFVDKWAGEEPWDTSRVKTFSMIILWPLTMFLAPFYLTEVFVDKINRKPEALSNRED